MTNIVLIHPDLWHRKDVITSECKYLAEVHKLEFKGSSEEVKSREGEIRDDLISDTLIAKLKGKCAGAGLLTIFCHCTYNSRKGLNFISEDGHENTIKGNISNQQIADLIKATQAKKVFLSGCNTALGGKISMAAKIKDLVNATAVDAEKIFVYGITKTQSGPYAPYHIKSFFQSGLKKWNPSRGQQDGIVKV